MTWVGKVAEQYNVVNVGPAGNDYIARLVLHELENHMRPNIDLLQWSWAYIEEVILIGKESVFTFNPF